MENEYVEQLRLLFNAFSTQAEGIFTEYDASLEPIEPEPEPEAKPRPVLPGGFTADVVGDAVLLMWDQPLPLETESVQVLRRPSFREGDTGWTSMTKEAETEFVDTNIPRIPAKYAGAHWEYKIRGYGYRLDGSPHASVYSEVLSVDEIELVEPVDPIEPEPIDPTPSEFRATDAIGRTAAENKLLRAPAMREERAPRTRVGSIGDVKRNDWTQGDLLMENLESVVEKGYAQWSSNMHNNTPTPRPGKYTWKNISVRGAADANQLKWGAREYNVPEREFIDCDFSDIPREHGFYSSMYASTLVDNCTFEKIGSQAIQWAHREEAYQQYSADCLPYAEKPTHIVRDTHVIDCAYKGDRPSFNATYFHPGSSEFPGTLLVENCSFVCKWDEPSMYNGKARYSTGGLVVTPTGDNAPLVDQCMMEKVHIKNTLFDFTAGDRAICSLRSIDEILIEDSVFIARNSDYNRITIDKDYGTMGNTKTKRIVLRNVFAEDVSVQVMLPLDADGKQASKWIPMHCPGGEIVIDGVTGEVIS